jgi:hypothetical protein
MFKNCAICVPHVRTYCLNMASSKKILINNVTEMCHFFPQKNPVYTSHNLQGPFFFFFFLLGSP